jgi:sulfide dehydrogenase cytochrome subunit
VFKQLGGKMLFRKSILRAMMGTVFIVSFPILVQADVAKIAKQCDTCHGKKGVSKDANVPTIAGFSAENIEDILSQYQSGSRHAEVYTPKGGKKSDMNAETKDMTAAEIKAIATHYATQKFVVAKQITDATLAKKGKKIHKKHCEKCHSEGGALAEDDAGILAGQWKPYLQAQFALIKSGKREIPKKMKKKLGKLSAEDIKAVTEFYASKK